MNIIKPRLELVVPIRFGMSGLYRLRVLRPSLDARLDTGWFPNLITDWGLNAKGTMDVGTYVHVGSGNTAPVAGNTTLETWVASSNTLASQSGGAQAGAPYYGWYRKTIRFAEGVAAGNISEVGVGPLGSSTDSLFSRALVLDGGGSPTTITVLADEFLEVTYEARMYPPTVDGSFVVGAHTVTTRASRVTTTGDWGDAGILQAANWQGTSAFDKIAYSGLISTIEDRPSGTSGQALSWTAMPYINNSLEREIEVFFDLSYGNVGGVRSLYVTSKGRMGAFQLQYDPVISKDDTKQLTLGLKVGWGRASI